MSTTPVGALSLRAYGVVFEREVSPPALASYFHAKRKKRGGRSRVQSPNDRTRRSRDRDRDRDGTCVAASAFDDAGLYAERERLEPELVRAVAWLAADGGRANAAGRVAVTLPEQGQAALAAVGVVWPAENQKTTVGTTAGTTAGTANGATNGRTGASTPVDDSPCREVRGQLEALARGLGALSRDLGSSEAAALSLLIGLDPTRIALERARYAGLETWAKYDTFRRYLRPRTRLRSDDFAHRTFALRTAFGFAWPVASDLAVSSPFGPRVHPVLGTRRRHRGVDLATPPGTSILVVADGVVVTAAYDAINGHFLEIDHGHGLRTTYCHNSRLDVRRGERVVRGQPIAASGGTGRVTGPHLHYEVEIDGTAIDPEFFRPRTAAARNDVLQGARGSNRTGPPNA
ncbi:MAG: M23 family metallopeptidase [Deltaproteobacteria bacterium]|nr:M23 family metallopeptidase [Deltaproteobacteria bacterium]